MWEFFWFISGILIYRILEKLLAIDKKIVFVKDIKHIAFGLIGHCFEDLIFTHSLKYKILYSDPSQDKEQIKRMEIKDERWISEWKNNTVIKLNSSVHPLYRSAVDVRDWQELVDILDKFYKEGRKQVEEIDGDR